MTSSAPLLKKLVKDFLEYLHDLKGYSALTVQTYNKALDEMLEMAEIEQEKHKITLNLMPYRLAIAHLSAKTISKKLSAIRSFVRYLQQQNIAIALLADESIKVPKTLPKPISHNKIQEALEVADEEAKFLIIMIYTLGLRISELQNIKLSDITSSWIRIRGKGDKERDIPLLPKTAHLIEKYIRKKAPKVYLFEKNGEKLSQNSLRYLINKSFAKIGLKVTPHQLRHSFATSLLNNGAPISDVSELLGHASMATTQIYTKLSSSLKRENYIKTHPLCSGEKV